LRNIGIVMWPALNWTQTFDEPLSNGNSSFVVVRFHGCDLQTLSWRTRLVLIFDVARLDVSNIRSNIVKEITKSSSPIYHRVLGSSARSFTGSYHQYTSSLHKKKNCVSELQQAITAAQHNSVRNSPLLSTGNTIIIFNNNIILS